MTANQKRREAILKVRRESIRDAFPSQAESARYFAIRAARQTRREQLHRLLSAV